MKMADRIKQAVKRFQQISLSSLFVILVSVIVMITSVVSLLIFVNLYRNDMEQNAITTSEQAVVQVKNTVFNYTEDMSDIMQMICANIQKEEEEANNFFSNLLKIRSDVVAVTSYDMNGKILKCWTNGQKLKENYIKNLSYVRDLPQEEGILNITKPHVESLFVDYYPWVVTISQNMQDANGNTIQVAVDISFYNIADYVDDVGIGQHGYCYIADDAGNIVYHPQQQLIYASLKEENQKNMENGTYIKSNVIYTVNSLQNCDWHIVGVCYVDEMITNKVERVVSSLVVILAIVLAGTVFLGSVFSDLFSKPVTSLVRAMGEFEGNSAEFVYHPVTGTKEISALSDSFEHMAVRIQKLMEEVRQEEISLRKTELKALQAQINPHFLYNTLDNIVWLIEGNEPDEAVEMVVTLSEFFRLVLSKGKEFITIRQEEQHISSYLQIQEKRYHDILDYHIYIDPEIYEYQIPKLTLQPLVENALYHGIKYKRSRGMIEITGTKEGENLYLTVADDGVGMDEDELKKLGKEISRPCKETESGFGLANVNERIRMYFGAEFGMKIWSEKGSGTRITIEIPAITDNPEKPEAGKQSTRSEEAENEAEK